MSLKYLFFRRGLEDVRFKKMDVGYLYRPVGFFGRTYLISDQTKDELARFLRHWYTLRTLNMLALCGLAVSLGLILEARILFEAIILMSALFAATLCILFAYYAMRLRHALAGSPLSEFPLHSIDIRMAASASLSRARLIFTATCIAAYAILIVYASINGFWTYYATSIARFEHLGPFDQFIIITDTASFALILCVIFYLARTIRLRRLSRLKSEMAA